MELCGAGGESFKGRLLGAGVCGRLFPGMGKAGQRLSQEQILSGMEADVMAQIRLDKFLAGAGLGTRSEVKTIFA